MTDTRAIARLADAEVARDAAAASKAANTVRADRRCWADVTAWCADHALEPLPAQPATVALDVAQLHRPPVPA